MDWGTAQLPERGVSRFSQVHCADCRKLNVGVTTTQPKCCARHAERPKVVDHLRPMVEAYRLWATGRMSASEFGEIADKCIIAYDKQSAW